MLKKKIQKYLMTAHNFILSFYWCVLFIGNFDFIHFERIAIFQLVFLFSQIRDTGVQLIYSRKLTGVILRLSFWNEMVLMIN